MSFFQTREAAPIPNKDLISWIFDEPKYDQNEPIYLDAQDPSRSLSLNQARVIVRKLVAGFQAAGLKKGECVCLHSFNDIFYPMLFLGIIAAGGIFAGTNPSYTQFELVHHIKTSKAKFLITEPEMLKNITAAAKDCKIPQSNIWIFDILGQDLPEGFLSFRELLEQGEKDWVRFDDKEICQNTTAARLFSSGTTGLPKAAILSHYNLIAEHELVIGMDAKPWKVRRILCLPMFHSSSIPIAHTSVPKAGQVAVVMRRFDLEGFLSTIEKFHVTDFVIVPPIVISVIMSPVTQKYSLKSVRSIMIGAAPLGRDSQNKLKDLLSEEAIVTQIWGMTEACCIASMFHYPSKDDTGSVGYILPGLEAKIINDNGEDISGYDVTGEICIRGPTIIPGYFENPRANMDSFDSEGFYKTGDIVYCSSASKKWYVVDRKKELIKVRGFQVAPPEIETVLLSHPHIIDAAVIGVKDPFALDVELPRAYVVRRPGRGGDLLDERTVKIHCGKKLARYKELTGGVFFVESIVKNASGKILKRLLREQASKEVALEQERARL